MAYSLVLVRTKQYLLTNSSYEDDAMLALAGGDSIPGVEDGTPLLVKFVVLTGATAGMALGAGACAGGGLLLAMTTLEREGALAGAWAGAGAGAGAGATTGPVALR
jgi:hypothetical protein